MNETLTRLPAGQWNVLDRPRVPPLSSARVPIAARFVMAVIRRVEKTTQNYSVFTTFARLGSIFPAHMVFLSQLLKRGRIPQAEKEIVILRVAWRLGCVYEWGHHVEMAKRLGVSQAQIDATSAVAVEPAGGRLNAFLVVVDELIANHALSGESWDHARRYATDDELLELCLLVGHYTMGAMTINSVGIQLEPEFAEKLAIG